MKIKSTEIKAKLEKLNKDITNSWMIIRTENLVENGFKRHYDMKALLDDINKKAIDRIQTKLDQFCINLGFKSRDYLNKLRNNLQLEINGLKKKLADFNDMAELDTSKAYMYLAA